MYGLAGEIKRLARQSKFDKTRSLLFDHRAKWVCYLFRATHSLGVIKMKLLLFSWLLNRVFLELLMILEKHGLFFLAKIFLSENYFNAYVYTAIEYILILEICYWWLGVCADFYTLINPFHHEFVQRE